MNIDEYLEFKMFHGRGFPRDHMLSLDSPEGYGQWIKAPWHAAASIVLAASESSDDDLEYLGMTPKWLVIIGDCQMW